MALKKEKHENGPKEKPGYGRWRFPAGVAGVYLMLLFFSTDRVFKALESSGSIAFHMLIPLAFVFLFMTALNLLINPGGIVKYIGKGAGIKGVSLSIFAGILSMGPVYAWYPLLKGLREKGAAASLIAIFLGNRAVKPFLLPVMVSYFGWAYVLVLTVLICLGSLAVGYTTGLFVTGNAPPGKN